jgi:hypothetical protein
MAPPLERAAAAAASRALGFHGWYRLTPAPPLPACLTARDSAPHPPLLPRPPPFRS